MLGLRTALLDGSRRHRSQSAGMTTERRIPCAGTSTTPPAKYRLLIQSCKNTRDVSHLHANQARLDHHPALHSQSPGHAARRHPYLAGPPRRHRLVPAQARRPAARRGRRRVVSSESPVNAPSISPHHRALFTEGAAPMPPDSPHRRHCALAGGAMARWAATLCTASAPPRGWALWATCSCVAAATTRAAR